jgi:hypothetical protein
VDRGALDAQPPAVSVWLMSFVVLPAEIGTTVAEA